MTELHKQTSNQQQTADDPNKSCQTTSEHHASQSIKAVAGYEILKGLASFLAGLSVLLWHERLPDMTASLVTNLHELLGKILVQQIENLNKMAEQANQNWQLVFWGIMGYTSLRFLEAYGLWKDKTWAYWYSVIGYGIFIPVELYYLVVEPFDWFHLFIFLLNIVIVVVVYRNMKQKGLLG